MLFTAGEKDAANPTIYTRAAEKVYVVQYEACDSGQQQMIRCAIRKHSKFGDNSLGNCFWQFVKQQSPSLEVTFVP